MASVRRRRSFPLCIAALGLVVLLGSATGPLYAQAPTVVRYWLWLDDPTEPMFDQLVKEFNATHPGITVEYQIVPLSEYHDKLATARAAGSGPDAWRFKVWWLGDFVKLTLTADRRRREGVGCWVRGFHVSSEPERFATKRTRDTRV